MKKLLIILCFAAFSASISAQGLYFGPQVGFSSVTIIEKSNLGTVDKKVKMGYQIGAAAEFEIMSSLYINGSVSFFQKGDKQGDDTFTSKTKIGYIDVPITVGYKVPIGNVSVFGNVGPYTSVAIVGKSYYSYEFAGEVFEEDHPLELGGEFSYYKRFDSGVTFGAGVEFKQWQVRANYSHGFIDITEGETVKSKNSVFNITGTYYIGRNF